MFPHKRFHGVGEVPLTPPANQQYYEEPASIVVDVSLTASQPLMEQGKIVDQDGDFRLQAISATKTGSFQIKLRLPSGRYFPESYVNDANFVGTAQFPVPVEPNMVYRSGQKLSFDIKDTSAAPNTIQLVFWGVKLLRVQP